MFETLGEALDHYRLVMTQLPDFRQIWIEHTQDDHGDRYAWLKVNQRNGGSVRMTFYDYIELHRFLHEDGVSSMTVTWIGIR